MSSEYGWRDEDIWELPLARFRQITASIQRRKYLEERKEAQRVSWLARSISTFVAGGYMVEKGSKNPAVEMAQSLAYDDVEAALFGHQAALPPVKVDESGKAADIDPNEAIQRALARNSTGSFERFGRMTGALDQRAKML